MFDHVGGRCFGCFLVGVVVGVNCILFPIYIVVGINSNSPHLQLHSQGIMFTDHSRSRLHKLHCYQREACDRQVFHVSLRNIPNELTDLHNFGYHKVPHVGAYGDNYHLSRPLVLLSMPTTTKCLMQLPASMMESIQVELSIESVAKELVHIVVQSALDHCITESNVHQATAVQREVVNNNIDEEIDIRMQAKKIVRKVLHVACKRWDQMNRRCSIDYLVASTKKLKISDTPSPPSLDLCPISDYEPEPSSISLPAILVDDDDDYEETSRRQLGKRRQRSESHDAVMLRELSVFQMERKSKSTTSSKSSTSLHSSKSDSSLSSPNRSPIVTPKRKARLDVNNIVSSIQRMSIVEVSEEEADEDEDDYTEMPAVTKSYQERAEEANDVHTSTSSTRKSDLTALPSMDYYIIIHSLTPPTPCQKFLCSNSNEVNLAYHCWLYPFMPVDPSLSVSEQVEMGVFEPSAGVVPVHQDLQDAGIAFNCVEPRTVCIHSCCFSPDNAQLQLLSLPDEKLFDGQLFVFFSVAMHGGRKVITFHAIPSSTAAETSLKEIITKSGDTLGDLLASLSGMFPLLTNKLQHLLTPLCYD